MAEQEYFSDQSIDLLAEVANGGGCSIVINSILTDLPDRLKGCKPIEYYRTVSYDTALSTALVDSLPGVFRPIGQPNELDNGVPYTLGFSENTFGVHADELFIPLVRLYDKRGEANTCSYAICETAFGRLEDSIVSTTLSEATVVLAVQEDRGLVVAKDMLSRIRDFITTLDTNRCSELQAEIEQVFDVKKYVAYATGYSPEVDYKEESRLRRRIDKVIKRVGGIGVHEEILIDYQPEKAVDDYSAKDYAQKTLLRRSANSDGYNILTQFVFHDAQTNAPLTALEVFIGDAIGVASVNKTIEPEKGTEVAFDFVTEKVNGAVRGDIVKGVVIETFSPEVQHWAHLTYQEITAHFADQFPSYKPQFALVYIEDTGKKRLVITDIGTDGLDLATGEEYNGTYTLDPERKWARTRKDERLQYRSESGKKIRTNRHMDEAIVAGIVGLNPNVNSTVWLTDRSVKQPFLDYKKKVARMAKGGYVVYNGRRWSKGSDITFRPVVECPLEIS